MRVTSIEVSHDWRVRLCFSRGSYPARMVLSCPRTFLEQSLNHPKKLTSQVLSGEVFEPSQSSEARVPSLLIPFPGSPDRSPSEGVVLLRILEKTGENSRESQQLFYWSIGVSAESTEWNGWGISGSLKSSTLLVSRWTNFIQNAMDVRLTTSVRSVYSNFLTPVKKLDSWIRSCHQDVPVHD